MLQALIQLTASFLWIAWGCAPEDLALLAKGTTHMQLWGDGRLVQENRDRAPFPREHEFIIYEPDGKGGYQVVHSITERGPDGQLHERNFEIGHSRTRPILSKEMESRGLRTQEIIYRYEIAFNLQKEVIQNARDKVLPIYGKTNTPGTDFLRYVSYWAALDGECVMPQLKKWAHDKGITAKEIERNLENGKFPFEWKDADGRFWLLMDGLREMRNAGLDAEARDFLNRLFQVWYP